MVSQYLKDMRAERNMIVIIIIAVAHSLHDKQPECRDFACSETNKINTYISYFNLYTKCIKYNKNGVVDSSDREHLQHYFFLRDRNFIFNVV